MGFEEQTVSLGAYKQVVWERDVAISQLKELGYELGEKIRDEDKKDNKSFNNENIKVGDKRFVVVNEYPGYKAKLATCKLISKRNEGKTKYTFKIDKEYKTVTFVDSSFGKKVFTKLSEAQDAANKLNK